MLQSNSQTCIDHAQGNTSLERTVACLQGTSINPSCSEETEEWMVQSAQASYLDGGDSVRLVSCLSCKIVQVEWTQVKSGGFHDPFPKESQDIRPAGPLPL